MGIYLNPGNEGFAESLRSEIYVDKTGMIAYTNQCLKTKNKFICVSRPRRFGKTTALEMLAAYYSCGCDSREMFECCEIAKGKDFLEYINKYNVIFLNMQQFLSEAEPGKMIEYLEQVLIEELQEEYKECLEGKTGRLSVLLRRVYAKTGRPFVFLIDEWDCVMREKQNAEELQRQYLDFLRNLLKDQIYVGLAYMTGILPIKKYGTHSALNMFDEFSMTDPSLFEEYVGFTEREVRALCERFQMDFGEISWWYDGYCFRKFQHVYNPRSVVEAVRRRKLSNYWTKTETYEALKIYMDMDYDGLREAVIALLAKEPVHVNTRTFQNDMTSFETKDDVLTLLIHLGYLAYDSVKEEAFIPNREITEEFENAMSVGGWKEIMKVLKASERLLEATIEGNAEEVAKGLDMAHEEVSSVLTYNDENSLGCAINLAYYSARKEYQVIRELPAGKGFADLVFVPMRWSRKPALVIELKYNKDVKAAIEQIKEKKYAKALERYQGEILLVGISYDRGTKAHSCIIEMHRKNNSKDKDTV